jgi:hypothetical protein
MKLWRWILLLVMIAALAAFGWHWVAEDPGYVWCTARLAVETTVVAAVLILLLRGHCSPSCGACCAGRSVRSRGGIAGSASSAWAMD